MLPRGITRTILDIRIWLLWPDEPSPFSFAHRIISHLPLLFIYVIFNLTSFYFLCLKLCISPLANSKLEYSEDFLFQINPRAKFSIKNGGSGATAFLKVVLQNFDVLAGPVVSLVYPLYASIKAIESKSPIDDQQWLTYWILYSLITLFELTFAKVIEWIPFWSYAKLIVTCWLVIPYFNGAAYVYEHFVRPTFVRAQKNTVNVWYVPREKDVFKKKDDIITAAEKYMQENGTDAFRDLVNRAEYRGRNQMNDHGIFEYECRD